MKRNTLDLMRCPYCGSKFRLAQIYEEVANEINYAVIKCNCNEFPILSGILMMKEGLIKHHILKYLKAGMNEKAISLALGPGGEDIFRISDYLESGGLLLNNLNKIYTFFIEILMQNITKDYRNDSPSFFSLPEPVYFKHRFSSETLWLSYPFMKVLEPCKDRILELGCGRGHMSFIISQYLVPRELFCADRTFKSLYTLKKYFSSDAQCICLDANYSLPFVDRAFDSIIMSDSFHYVFDRSNLAKEMVRIKSKNGLILLLHLHNSLANNIAAGYGLKPKEWISLLGLSDQEVRAFPEGMLIKDFLYNDILDLSQKYSEAELDSDSSIAIMATNDASLYKIYSEVDSILFQEKGHYVINPLYIVKQEKKRLIFKKNYPCDSLRIEYPIAEEYMPSIYEVTDEISLIFDLNGSPLSNLDTNEELIKKMVKRFIVINVPKLYL